jgi:hypothetical protein
MLSLLEQDECLDVKAQECIPMVCNRRWWETQAAKRGCVCRLDGIGNIAKRLRSGK